MRYLTAFALVASLSGCILVTDDDGHRHYAGRPAPIPPPPPHPPVYRLDCAWMASWNCWDQAVAEAAACAPETWAGPSGGLYADNGYACYYPDGSAVFFDEPVTVPLSPYHRWNFTMEDPWGQTCAWFEETATSISLATASGVVDVVIDGAGISVTCQDGTQWYNPDPWALDRCATAEWEFPSYWRETSRTWTTFGLSGGDQPVLWSCDW